MAEATRPPVPEGTAENPMATDGFEFVEYTAPDVADLDRLFTAMGFRPVARHRSKNVTLYQQGGVNFIVNGEPDSFAQAFARVHGPSCCAIAFRVKNAAAAFERAGLDRTAVFARARSSRQRYRQPRSGRRAIT